MGSIVFQIVLMVLVVGLLIYVARDDRRNRVLRAEEDAEALRQTQIESRSDTGPDRTS
jgi:hypothetical protein